jgi:hypothetical protein
VYRTTVRDVVAGWRLALRSEGIQYHAIHTNLPFGQALREALVRPGGLA